MGTQMHVEVKGSGHDWTVTVNGEQQGRSDLMTLWAVYGSITRQLEAAFAANPHLDTRR